MKRCITYMMMALAMVSLFIVSGCGGNLGSSQDFSGTWGYVETASPIGNNEIDYEYNQDTIYVVTLEKKSEHTYAADFKDYKYSYKGSSFLNRDEYERGDRWITFFIPDGPNSQGLLPKVEPVYEFKLVAHDMETISFTERDGVLYVDESGLEYTYDKDNDALVSGKTVLHRIKDGDITSLKEEVQQHIKDFYTKEYVDTKKRDITNIKFNDAPKSK
ncbi:hypothetical protein [Veillonella criceti]|uniref:Lipoprotein n=1 Tax=Veillonella criceti TaxID=103891 RepID=A0A380NNR4_9FIRM|nr:hypothetical protein [Veillonella criceti]SUP44442.1 Uncharacterised protein [Veillonella criceti]